MNKTLLTTHIAFNTKRESLQKLGIFSVAAIFVLMITSWCSFLYPMSLSPDANTMMVAAKHMCDGKILYKDIFEQKGPLAYLLYIIAWKIMPGTFHGIYFVEVLFAVAYFWFTYKTINIINRDNTFKSVVLTVIACTSSYASFPMAYGGEVEEFCLPFMAYLLWIIMEMIYYRANIKRKQFFFVGIHAGLIFWAKYFCLAIYVPCIVFCIYIFVKRNQKRQLSDMFLYGFLGFFTVFIAMAIYFTATNSWKEMLDVYFMANIFQYSQTSVTSAYKYIAAVMWSFLTCIANSMFNILYVFGFFLIIAVLLRRHENGETRELALFVVFACASTCVILALSRAQWAYYFLPMNVFYGAILVLCVAEYEDIKKIIVNASILCAVMMCFYFGVVDRIQYNREYQNERNIVEIIKAQPGASVLVFDSMDCGFYIMCDYYPDLYYFMHVNARGEEITSEYSELIEKNQFDFVILQRKQQKAYSFKLLDSSGYELAYEAPGDGWFMELYKKQTVS